MYVTFTTITYLCLCFIKVVVLAPSSVCFLLPPHIYLRLLSCIGVFHVTAKWHACLSLIVLRVGVKTLYYKIYALSSCTHFSSLTKPNQDKTKCLNKSIMNVPCENHERERLS